LYVIFNVPTALLAPVVVPLDGPETDPLVVQLNPETEALNEYDTYSDPEFPLPVTVDQSVPVYPDVNAYV
jgi:hypothetical protein